MNDQSINQAKPKRQPVSQKTRFEVFKRDSFKCQYCGKCAPEVILHVDHIHPVSKGGDSDILNLITACSDCNGGKSDRLLTDDSAMAKQRAQLEELNERREQLEQMLKWREGMKGIEGMALDAIDAAWQEVAPGFTINAAGNQVIKKLVASYGLNAVLDAVGIAGQYIQQDPDGIVTESSAANAFKKIGGICRVKSQPDWKRELYYLRGILRNRLSYVNQVKCMHMLESAYEAGASLEDLKQLALTVKNWTAFSLAIHEMTAEE